MGMPFFHLHFYSLVVVDIKEIILVRLDLLLGLLAIVLLALITSASSSSSDGEVVLHPCTRCFTIADLRLGLCGKFPTVHHPRNSLEDLAALRGRVVILEDFR